MIVQVVDPLYHTFIFGIFFVCLLFGSLRSKNGAKELFPPEVTNEIKGFAVLAIVFSHIGYFLVSDPKFLFPFSAFSGVGVDIFLLLSGFGLTVSELKKHLSPKQFYKKRLGKIYIPIWIVLGIFLLLDFLVLHIHYSPLTLTANIFGIFPHADIYKDFNSPLWYITLTLFYYGVFPLVFYKKHPSVSALVLLLFGAVGLVLPLPISDGVRSLYQLHFMAFPLGILLALFLQRYEPLLNRALSRPFRILSMVLLFGGVCFFTVYPVIGKTFLLEESISLLLTLCIVFFFLLKKSEFRLLSLFGVYSYEIYLIHWPLLYRYDVLYKYFSPGVATVFSIGFLLAGGIFFQKGREFFHKKNLDTVKILER